MDEGRWVVVDTETSGLDPHACRLLAIAAVAVRVDWVARRLVVTPGDSFEALLRQDTSGADHANILLHGIGVQRQAAGMPARDALEAFAAFAGTSPLLAFHAPFDEAVLRRVFLEQMGQGLANPWADIEPLCAAIAGDIAGGSLDDWMAHFGLTCARRHQAAADAMVEAELLLRLWPRLVRECRCWDDVRRLADARRWLAPRRGG